MDIARWSVINRPITVVLFSAFSLAFCTTVPDASAASAALWIAGNGNNKVEELLPTELKPNAGTPLTFSDSNDPEGVCFDKSNNLWVTGDSEQIQEFPPSQLKKLGTGAVPSPAVTITSSSFTEIVGCAFDKHGNLWLADLDNDSADEISLKQLQAGSGSITPAIIITDSAEASGSHPGFVAFDKSGNLWLDGREAEKLFEFSASDLSSGGDKSAAVVLGGGGSFNDPGQIAFDGKGNLWVSSFDAGTVVMFLKKQLTSSNNDQPAVTLSSGAFNGPWGVVFRGAGPLWVSDFRDGNVMEFLPSQTKKSGAPQPKVLLSGVSAIDSWQISFGPAFGKLVTD